MKKQRPEYEALVPRIASGEISRKQAAEISAEQTGLSPGSFTVWLHDSGQAEKIKSTRGNAGDNSVRALVNTNPDKAQAYADAIKAVTENGMNSGVAAKKFEVSYQYLLRKIKAARDEAQPKQPPAATPEDEDLVRAVLSDPVRVAALAKAIREAHV